MKLHHRVLLAGLFLGLLVAVFWNIQGHTKQDEIPVSVVPELPAFRKVCQSKQRVFSEASACEIAPSGLSQMQQLCAQTLTRQRANTLKQASLAMFMEETGFCQFRYDHQFAEDAAWSLLTYDVQFGVGMGPSYSIAEPSLPASILGPKCEKFGEISFSCKFENDSKCSKVIFRDKMNFTGFQCMDGVQY